MFRLGLDVPKQQFQPRFVCSYSHLFIAVSATGIKQPSNKPQFSVCNLGNNPLNHFSQLHFTVEFQTMDDQKKVTTEEVNFPPEVLKLR